MQSNIPIRVLYCKSFNIHTITSLISIQEEKMENRPNKNFLSSYAKLSGESIIQSAPKKLTFTGSSAISFSIKSICMPDPKFTVLKKKDGFTNRDECLEGLVQENRQLL